ncbi:MAG: FtsQ-type POTRA domain-containing protein [Ruminococcus sp.]|nr:FtsQ-type POTRA domain-containing protein [Ruminococcus sp.]
MSARRRKRRVRFTNSAVYATGVVFAFVTALILCLTVFFRIKDVRVEGVTLYREEQVLNVGGIELEMNMIRTDPSAAEKRILDNLVYIDEVRIKKQYPDTVVIQCTEAVKAADIETGGGYYVLSESGRILEGPNREPTGGLPVIKGFELKSVKSGEELESFDRYKAKILTELLSELREQDFGGIGLIDMTSRADIVLVYEDRIDVRLGSSADISFKLSFFKSVIASLTEDFEGQLIYNGATVGVSAIPMQRYNRQTPAPEPVPEETAPPKTETQRRTGQNEDGTWEAWWITDDSSTAPAQAETTPQNDWQTEQQTDWQQDNGYTEQNDWGQEDRQQDNGWTADGGDQDNGWNADDGGWQTDWGQDNGWNGDTGEQQDTWTADGGNDWNDYIY